jgi:DNA excision repair protein ERCC-4
MQPEIAVDGGQKRHVATHEGRATTERCVLRVDCSERNAALLDLARGCGEFDVRVEHLAVGDYFVGDAILVERKTYADFAVSIADGRLFPQAAALARSPHRPAVLLEGPRPQQMPDVHPHALKGALVSLAIMWRLPVLIARDPEDSLQILRMLAHQVHQSPRILRRYDRKPKRLASKKLYVLQGLPGVGPTLASRLLSHFGSIEKVIASDEGALAAVRGIGPAKATAIRELIR